MNRQHQAMFNRAFERLYQEACESGLNHKEAEAWAADAAWSEYEQYCDQKLEEMKNHD